MYLLASSSVLKEQKLKAYSMPKFNMQNPIILFSSHRGPSYAQGLLQPRPKTLLLGKYILVRLKNCRTLRGRLMGFDEHFNLA